MASEKKASVTESRTVTATAAEVKKYLRTVGLGREARDLRLGTPRASASPRWLRRLDRTLQRPARARRVTRGSSTCAWPSWIPTDVKGIQYFSPLTQKMEWAPTSELPTQEDGDNYDYVILFLDEMNSAPPAVQAAGYQLVLNRRIGKYFLPDNAVIVAAGNRESDKGVTYRMPSPLSNRFTHFEMRVDHESWLNWAVDNQIHPDVIGYLSQHKMDLFDFAPASNSRAFATPRSWTFCSDILRQDPTLNEKEVTDIVAGTVGEGIAHKFNGHRKFAGQLPHVMDVLTGKVTDLSVKEISAHYTLMVNFCYELKELHATMGKTKTEEWHKMFDYMLAFIMKNFSTELIIMGMRTAVVNYKLQVTYSKLKNWNKFHQQYGKYILSAVS
jgi:hypothetical protein